MTTLAERLSAALLHAGITKAELARAVGVKPPSVQGWFNGKSKFLRGENLLSAARALRVDQDWLATGRGKMIPGAGSEDSVSSISATATAPGYLRLGLLGEGGMGSAVENQDFPEVIREMDFSQQHLRSIFGFLPKPGRVALMTGRGHSMEPLISHGDVVMVDTSITFYEDAGPYVINLGDGQQIKTLQNRGDAIYVVSLNENVGGPAFKAPADMLIGGKVYVVQKFVMAH